MPSSCNPGSGLAFTWCKPARPGESSCGHSPNAPLASPSISSRDTNHGSQLAHSSASTIVTPGFRVNVPPNRSAARNVCAPLGALAVREPQEPAHPAPPGSSQPRIGPAAREVSRRVADVQHARPFRDRSTPARTCRPPGCAGERPSKGVAHTKYARLHTARIRAISLIDQSRSSKSRIVTGDDAAGVRLEVVGQVVVAEHHPRCRTAGSSKNWFADATDPA